MQNTAEYEHINSAPKSCFLLSMLATLLGHLERYLLSRVRASRVLPSRVDCNEFAFSGQNGVI